MGVEYEVKVRLSEDLERVREALRAIGGVFVDVVRETDYYVDLSRCAGVDDAVFRIRVKEAGGARRSELAVKGPKRFRGPLKVREEVSVALDRADELVDILRSLGFRVMCVTKIRETYSLPGFKVFIDSVTGLGNYVEVEVSGAADVDSALASISRLMDALGIRGEVMFKSYLDMLLEGGIGCAESSR